MTEVVLLFDKQYKKGTEMIEFNLCEKIFSFFAEDEVIKHGIIKLYHTVSVSKLAMAVQYKRKQLIDQLLKKIDSRSMSGIICKALIVACSSGQTEMALKLLNETSMTWHEPIIAACSGGHLETLQEVAFVYRLRMRDSSRMWNWGLKTAAENGHLHIINYLVSKGADDWRSVLQGASQGGKLEIVNMAMKHTSAFKEALLCACFGGKLEIVKLLLEKVGKLTLNDWEDIIRESCKGGNLSVVKYVISRGGKPSNCGLVNASTVEVAEFMAEKGANKFQTTLTNACIEGYYEVAKFCIEKKERPVQIHFAKACQSGNLDLIDLIVKHIKKEDIDYNVGLYSAVFGGHLEIVKMMIAKGGKVNQMMLHAAADEEHYDVLEYLKNVKRSY